MVAIPPLVAHGYQCLSMRDVILNYYVTEPYNPADPDEGRIAWNDRASASTGRSRTSDVRLLVTGGAGFIGSEFVRMTLRDHPDDSVIVLDKLTYAGNERNLDSVRDDARFRFVRGDICDAATVRDARRRRPTSSSTSRPSRTSTARSKRPVSSSSPTSTAPSSSWTRHASTGTSVSCR